jgi:hypothetical protein
LKEAMDEDQTLIDEKLDQIIDAYTIQIENICLEILARPDTPILSIKNFKECLKLHLKNCDQVREALLYNGEEKELNDTI